MSFQRRDIGAAFTPEYKAFIEGSDGIVSSWHDIPLFPAGKKLEDRIVNMVVEIPRWTNAKMEISKAEKFNPIVQDTKKGKLRFVDNVFPFKGYMWNYGAIPQTWEDPNEVDIHTGEKGDDDPLDIMEVGETVFARGTIVQVKILGVIALIDEGETDWKILAINVNDPLADELNTLEDVRRVMPGLLKASYDWLRLYKIPAGKPENRFAFNGEVKDASLALKVIEDTHNAWKKLVSGEIASKHNLANSKLANSKTEQQSALTMSASAQGDGNVEEPKSVQKWHFVNKNF